MRFTLVRNAVLLGVSALLLASAGGDGRVAAASAQSTYDSTDEAVAALINAVRSDDPTQAITEVLGADGADIADSGDPVADTARREKFVAAYDEQHEVKQEEEGKSVLYIGKDEYPFPIPLVADSGKWRWDAAAGLDVILSRRIGENELSTIEVMNAFVDAQEEYAEQERDAGTGVQYARRLMSRDGHKDGLYWPTNEDEEASPMGPLIAQAQLEGYRRDSDGSGAPTYHGYVFRMLYGQGRDAKGGARDYIMNDRMIGGFALIATPADYGNSGVMTFIVNQDGEIYEQDLGADSADLAASIKLFNPDADWKMVEKD